ncbi:MAG: hypothetical protein ABJE66_28280 [Deltaproteobacteria bacterium]
MERRHRLEDLSRETAAHYRRPPKHYFEDESMFQAVLRAPDDDLPRVEYAEWLRIHSDENTRWRGECISEGMALARAAREEPTIDFEHRRPTITSTALSEISSLESDDLVSSIRVHRGFVEKVAIRATNLMKLADELFGAAPIRFLDLIDVNRVVEELARWPGLARMRALTFPIYGDDDLLTDATLDQLLESPYLTGIRAIRLVGQTKLTPAAYRRILTAPTLPQLSLFDIPATVLTCWEEPTPVWSTARPQQTLSFFERAILAPPASGDLRDTPILCPQRPEDWIAELERELGYQPCLHPEDYYGRYHVAVEVPIEHPIALDPAVMALRGESIAERGPKPSLMKRRAEGKCAICGSGQFEYRYGPPDPNPYDYDPNPGLESLDCRQCGTKWEPWSPAVSSSNEL